jgi:hypothetical protein
MHDYRKFKVSVNGRIGRTARLSERLRRVLHAKSRLTGNAAAGNAYNVADMASLLRETWSSSATGVTRARHALLRDDPERAWPLLLQRGQ